MEAADAISLLEQNPEEQRPIVKNPEELLKLRDEVKRIEYSDVVRKETRDLPETVGELRKRLDEMAKDLAENDEEENAHEREVPGIVLRNERESERELEKVGWDREAREEAKRLLRQRLRLNGDEHADEGRIENALHLIIASGKTAPEALAILRDDAKFDAYGQAFNQMAQDNPQMAKTNQNFAYLRNELGIQREDHIQRFVLDDGLRDNLDNEFDQKLPQDLYDLAWNIQYHEHMWSLHGKFPILQMQVRWEDAKKDNGEIEIDEQTGRPKQRLKGRYVVNQANFLRWLRERMYYRWDAFETDDPIDFYSSIAVHKGQYATVNLATMIFDKDRYFTDETGHEWNGLFNQVFITPFDLQHERQYMIEYDRASKSEEDLSKAYQGWSHLSKFTRKINGQSMLDRAMMLPLDYTGKNSDAKLGEALNAMYLAYFYLADFDKLKEVLGENSPFFKREGWIQAAADFESGGTAGRGGIAATNMPLVEKYFGAREKYFDAAFDENGKATEETKEAFLRFINPYYQEVPPQTMVKVLAQILQNSVKEKLHSKESNTDVEGLTDEEKQKGVIDDNSLKYAWLKAWSWFYFSGGLAKANWPYPTGDPSGHLAETKWLYTDGYRMKYMHYGGAGNQYTIPMFKQLSVPFFEGMLVENANTVYHVWDDKKGKLVAKERQLTPIEVMLKLRQSNIEFENRRNVLEEQLAQVTDETQKERLRREIDRLDDVGKNYHKMLASQLEFNDNAMRVYSKNLIDRARVLYDQIMHAKETAFDKFITYDGIFRGPSFNREAWQEALQDKYFTPLRYLFEANGATQLNMIIRAPVLVSKDSEGHAHWEWKDQYLGERMLGHQVLDIPTFWKRVKDITTDEWQVYKERGYRSRRGYIIRPDGKHEIDYNKAQDNKTMVYKQWMLMKIAADLWAHIDRHSSDPAYTLEHYDSIIEAIKALPGDMVGDEYDMRGVRVNKPLFSKEQIKWLKRMSRADSLFFRQFMSDIFIGDRRKKESLLGESTGIILSAIFKGYG